MGKHRKVLICATKTRSDCQRHSFTLLELIVVISIIAVIMALVAPTFVTLRGGGDVTATAYTVAGLLEQARSYAMAQNTYVWVGFFEEDGGKAATNPATPGIGRIVISTVASADGTTVYDPNSSTNPDPIAPTRLRQLNNLVRLENFHLDIFADGSGTGSGFGGRPPADSDPFSGSKGSRIGNINASPATDAAPPTNSKFPFHYPLSSSYASAQYAFRKTIQFSPRGEASINSTYDLRRYAEIGLRTARGNVVNNNDQNVAAIQFSGIAGNFKIYRQ